MNKLMQIRKNKKGFTLVELLVVLVIIAILMAAIIPSMLGFIDKAKEETAMAECRNVAVAAGTVINEQYGLGKPLQSTNLVGNTAQAALLKQINDMADLKGGAITELTVVITDAKATTKIESAEYTLNGTGGAAYVYTVDATNKGTWAKKP